LTGFSGLTGLTGLTGLEPDLQVTAFHLIVEHYRQGAVSAAHRTEWGY
jgi:hypothetical protein